MNMCVPIDDSLNTSVILPILLYKAFNVVSEMIHLFNFLC